MKLNRTTRLYLLALAAMLTACGQPAEEFHQGYVEGEWLYLSAPLAGYLDVLNVTRGARLNKGDKVFSLSSNHELHGLQEAEARALAAAERTRNLTNPRRPQEIAALEAQVRAAEAALQLSTTQLKQQEALAARSPNTAMLGVGLKTFRKTLD